MTYQIKNDDGVVSAVLDGRLDSGSSGEFETALLKELGADTKALEIDLEKVDFISSRGLRVLVGAYKLLNGKEFTLKNANSSVQELLKLSGLTKIFTLI